jgi:hypothetical protein
MGKGNQLATYLACPGRLPYDFMHVQKGNVNIVTVPFIPVNCVFANTLISNAVRELSDMLSMKCYCYFVDLEAKSSHCSTLGRVWHTLSQSSHKALYMHLNVSWRPISLVVGCIRALAGTGAMGRALLACGSLLREVSRFAIHCL